MDRRAHIQDNRTQRANPAAQTVVISPKAESEAAEEQKPTGIRGLFDGLSVSQVTAGALAAVTSMLLSAQIGIAGSVIGVAVGSVVSTVSSQLYKKFLAGSAEKIRGLASNDDGEQTHNGTPTGNVSPNEVTFANGAAYNCERGFEYAETTMLPRQQATQSAAQTTVLPHVAATNVHAKGATRVMAPANVAPGEDAAQQQSNTPHINSAAGRTGNASHATGVIEIEAQKKKAMQRRVLAVSVASSIVAILLFAGLVLAFTGGKGLGTKVVPFTGETVTSQLASESETEANDNATGATQSNPDEHASNSTAQNSTNQESQSNATAAPSNSSSTSTSGTNESSTSSTGASTSGTSNAGSNGSSNSGSSTTGSSSNSASNSGSGSTNSTGNSGNSSSSTASGSNGSTSTSGATGTGTSTSNSSQTGSSN